MRYNILMKDLGFTKLLLYRLEDEKEIWLQKHFSAHRRLKSFTSWL